MSRKIPRCQGPCLKNCGKILRTLRQKKDLQIDEDSSQQLPNISRSASSFFYHSLPLIIFILKLLQALASSIPVTFFAHNPSQWRNYWYAILKGGKGMQNRQQWVHFNSLLWKALQSQKLINLSIIVSNSIHFYWFHQK